MNTAATFEEVDTPELEAELKRRIAAHGADPYGGHTWE